MTDDKIYTFEEAVKKQGLYVSVKHSGLPWPGNFLLVGKGTPSATGEFINGVIFISSRHKDTDLGKNAQKISGAEEATYKLATNLELRICLKTED
jgi:hypothetical protein